MIFDYGEINDQCYINKLVLQQIMLNWRHKQKLLNVWRAPIWMYGFNPHPPPPNENVRSALSHRLPSWTRNHTTLLIVIGLVILLLSVLLVNLWFRAPEASRQLFTHVNTTVRYMPWHCVSALQSVPRKPEFYQKDLKGITAQQRKDSNFLTSKIRSLLN